MKIKVLGSSSAGNCYILEDKDGNQLLLECGLKYEQIAPHLNFEKLDFVLLSHFHKDHSLSKQELEQAMVTIYSPENTAVGMTTSTGHWLVRPIELQHNTQCFGYLITNRVEQKWICFCTDTMVLPRIADVPFDLMMLECNYNFDKVIENARDGKLINDGYKNHMALENLTQWLSKSKNLMAIHLSEHGNLDKELMVEQLTPLADKFYIAKKGVEIEI